MTDGYFRLIILLSTERNTSFKEEGTVLFNNALNTFYLWLYGIKHMLKNHSGSERGNLLPPLHGLFFPISSKGTFICIIPQPLLRQWWSSV